MKLRRLNLWEEKVSINLGKVNSEAYRRAPEKETWKEPALHRKKFLGLVSSS